MKMMTKGRTRKGADNPLVVINPERPTHCVDAAARDLIFNSNVGKY